MLPDARLRLLRTHRTNTATGHGLGVVLQRQRARLERAARDGGGVEEAWAAVVPVRLRGRATLVGLRAGTLTVRCPSTADRFALDRWLRSGGERQLRAAAAVALNRVRLVLR